MARFLLTWEFGGGLGHLTPLARLAQALLQRGHHVDLASKDLSLVHRVLGPWADRDAFRLWQAPVPPPSAAGLPEPASHAEILLRAGYADAGALATRVRAWRQLFDACQPDLLLTDQAPTALIAARGHLPRVATFGNGFFVPPPGRPIPPFRDWEPVPGERIEAAEAQALANCNEVLGALRSPGLPTLSALFDTDELFLLGWPELDHFAPWRGDAAPRSWGPVTLPAVDGPGWPWPEAPGLRIVAYLQRTHPAIEAVLPVLRAMPAQVLLSLAGVSADEAARLGHDRLRVETAPLDLPAALARADLLLVSGIGAAYQALALGVPTVMLPMHAEQLLFARRVAAAGVGVMLWPGEVAAGLGRALQAVGAGPGFRAAARALAARHPGETLPAVVARCEALVALSGPVR